MCSGGPTQPRKTYEMSNELAEESDERPWVDVDSTDQFACRLFTVVTARRREPKSGQEADFYYLQAPNWVNVLALTDDDQVLFVRQWRHGVRQMSLELPGGVCDPGEAAEVSAARELREETGYVAKQLYRLGAFHPDSAILSNTCTSFLATGCTVDGPPQFDVTEHCATEVIPYGRVEGLVADGTIRHGVVLAALHYERLRRAGVLTPGAVV